nr:hypothetical protein BC332_09686 [Ipomoea batatas]
MAGIRPFLASSTPDSGGRGRMRWFSGAGGQQGENNACMDDEKRRKLRESEKCERLMHLICWGPK